MAQFVGPRKQRGYIGAAGPRKVLNQGTRLPVESFSGRFQDSIAPDLSRGSGTPTFTRATTATVIDWEGIVRTALSGEARFQGARREYSLVSTKSEDWTNGAWTKTIGTVAATSLTSTGANQTVLQGITAASSNYVLRVEMSRLVGTGNIQLTLDGGSTWTTVALTAAVQVFSIAQTAVTNPSWGICIVTSGDSIYASKIAVYDTTGRSNTNPPEYVSVGVLSAPYHGAGVDGVKYFNTLNGNTVASNVVTEAAGAPITNANSSYADAKGPYGYLAEWQRTQYLGVTSAPATQTTASLGTGTYCYWVTGTGSLAVTAGTATITGGGNASAGVPKTFTVTGAGTVVATVTGSLTFFQLENGAFPSSQIPNAGAAGTSVTRNADVLTYLSAGNISDTAGTAYAEVTLSEVSTGNKRFISTASTAYQLYANATTLGVYDGTTAVTTGALTANTIAKAASVWSASEKNISVNGLLGTADAYNTFGSGAAIGIGTRSDGIEQPFSTIRNVKIWQSVLTAAQIAEISR